LAGQHGRIAFADSQARVQTLPNIDDPLETADGVTEQ
jgi:hypothetical protein